MTVPYGLLADLHLHPWSAFATTTSDGQNGRLVGLLNEIDRAAQEVSTAGGNKLILAGDVFHVRGSVAPSVLNAVRDRLKTLATLYGVEFHIMPGNHDLEGKESTRLSSAVTALEDRHVLVHNFAGAPPGFGLKVVLVPWVESIDALKATCEEIANNTADSSETDLILHAPIDGVIKGLPDHGLSPDYLAGLGFKRVFAGHYHNHKQVHAGFAIGGAADEPSKRQGEVYSIGALAHHTWSDVGSKAGFLIVYPDRVDWRKSHLPEFIDLSQLAGLEPDEVPLLVDGNYVRVRVEASKTKEVEKARQELLDMGARGVIVQAQPKAPTREGATSATVASGASLEVSVSDFIRAMHGGAIGGVTAEVTKAALDVLSTVDAMGE